MKKYMKIFLSMLVCLFVMGMPSAVVSAAERQTTEDGKFTYTCNYYDETATIHEYLGEETVVEFPSKVDGCKVTEICNDGYYRADCVINWNVKETITKIVIPNTVKKIGAYAFDGCKALETVNMSTKIEFVGGCAFRNCESLKQISFPKTLKEMGEVYVNSFGNCGPFEGCASLETVTIDLKSKLKYIPDYTFSDCISLKKITFPNKLEEIGDYAFNNCVNLSSINFPDTLKVIDTSAFDSCKKITNVKFGSKIERIGGQAFQYTGIKKLTLPKNALIKFGAFRGCENLKSVVVSKGVEMETGVFEGCVNLEKVTIKYGVTTIPQIAFKGTAIKNILIPASVTKIYDRAFENCNKLVKVFILNSDVEMDGFTSGSKVRLYGYKNSTVQTYAKQIGVRFKSLTCVKNVKAKNTSKGKVKVSWKKVSGVKKYTIYRSTSKDGTYKKIGTTTKTSYTDKKAKKGKTYYYRITIDYEDSTGVKLTGVKSASAKVKVKK